ncbi:A/G-specific adenine glycosylase [Puniceicoccus vermicola]|uniref:A/G-specific adenine glycosylase n=1 Tax=Puniceicoccus vermicola TaxID=388746 RepID=UPI0031B564F4
MPKSNDCLPRWANADLPAARKDLARWFGKNARVLPWRTETTVYRTVVSEFMLQQTRVSTVLPYFEKWVTTFPGFAELAAAEEGEVLGLWQGLGYYSRARNLHKLAKRIVEEGIPDDLAGWRELPGIGGYTAAAITSIAQGLPAAVVDGNVVRVLARLSADETTWKASGEAVKAFGPLAEEFLDRDHPGRHNESMMELGAVVCLPRSPLCTICPLVQHCHGAAQGIAGELPRIVKAKKTEKTVRRAWAVRGKTVLLREIPATAKRLAGMLELPELTDLPESWKPDPTPFAKRKRGIGNESITEWFHVVPEPGRISKKAGLRWVSLDALAEEPLSGPHRRWIGELLKGK